MNSGIPNPDEKVRINAVQVKRSAPSQALRRNGVVSRGVTNISMRTRQIAPVYTPTDIESNTFNKQSLRIQKGIHATEEEECVPFESITDGDVTFYNSLLDSNMVIFNLFASLYLPPATITELYTRNKADKGYELSFTMTYDDTLLVLRHNQKEISYVLCGMKKKKDFQCAAILVLKEGDEKKEGRKTELSCTEGKDWEVNIKVSKEGDLTINGTQLNYKIDWKSIHNEDFSGVLNANQIGIGVGQVSKLIPDQNANLLFKNLKVKHARISITQEETWVAAPFGEREVTRKNWTSIFPEGTEQTEEYKMVKGYFVENSTRALLIIELGSGAGVSELAAYLTEKSFDSYALGIPQSIFLDDSFRTLAATYSNLYSQTYFYGQVNASSNFDPKTDTAWNRYYGLKSIVGIYNPVIMDQGIVGQFLGLLSSSKYDLSAFNPLTSFDSSSITNEGISLGNTMSQKLTDSRINWVTKTNTGPIIALGVCADGTPIEYWFGWDHLLEHLKRKLNDLIKNAANIPSQRLAFFSRDILTIKSFIEAQIKTYMTPGLGVVSTFAQELTPTGVLRGEGQIDYIPYEQYRRDDPFKVSVGIYDGFSAVIYIERFLRRLEINVTLD